MGHLEWEISEDEDDLDFPYEEDTDFDDGFMLPPPLIPIDVPFDFWTVPRPSPRRLLPLLPELWRRVAAFMDPQTLCHATAVAPCCQFDPEVERELWANLCRLHWPKMYASVLSERLCLSVSAAEVIVQANSPSTRIDFTRPAFASVRPPLEDCARGSSSSHLGYSRSNTWPAASPPDSPRLSGPSSPRRRRAGGKRRGRAKDARGENEAGTEPLQPSPEFGPVSCPSCPGSSPGVSPWDVIVPDSPAPSPSMTPMSAPTALNTPLLPPIEGDEPDWRLLYCKRKRRGLEWEEEKRTKAQQQSERRRVSELTHREIGCLQAAAHRLKICTLCGEKFSPGEARFEPSACCFHPGNFEPVCTEGWSRSELKQLALHARQALRSAGGSSYVQRHPRASRGHGHWLKGLGVLSKHSKRFLSALEGETAAEWSCCHGKGLFAEGCSRGMHRHF